MAAESPLRPTPRTYRAFISYRHTDNIDRERRWAEWVHHELESYRIPPALRGRENLAGEPIPETLFPVFRDAEELASGQELAAAIDRALEASDSLIVLCSPRSAASPWVDREILRFQELGKEDRILPVIIEGQPDAIARAASGEKVDPTLECLPPSLRRPRDGDEERFATPLAVDLRIVGSAEQAYTSASAFRAACEQQDLLLPESQRRSRRELAELETREEKRLRRALLRLVAGVILVDFAELTRRDEAARAVRARRVALVSSAVTVVVGVLAVFAFIQSDQRQRLLVSASDQELGRARDAQDQGDWERALAHLERSLRYWPENAAAATMLWRSLREGPASQALTADFLVEGLTDPQTPVFFETGESLALHGGEQIVTLDAQALKTRRIQLPATRPAPQMVLGAQNQLLVALEGDQWAIVEDQATRPRIIDSSGGTPLAVAPFDPSGQRVICGSGESLNLVEVNTGSVEMTIEFEGSGIRFQNFFARWSPDGSEFIAFEDGILFRFQSATGDALPAPEKADMVTAEYDRNGNLWLALIEQQSGMGSTPFASLARVGENNALEATSKRSALPHVIDDADRGLWLFLDLGVGFESLGENSGVVDYLDFVRPKVISVAHGGAYFSASDIIGRSQVFSSHTRKPITALQRLGDVFDVDILSVTDPALAAIRAAGPRDERVPSPDGRSVASVTEDALILWSRQDNDLPIVERLEEPSPSGSQGPSAADSQIGEFATLIGGFRFTEDGLRPVPFQRRVLWRSLAEKWQGDDPQWKEVMQWWAAGRPAESP